MGKKRVRISQPSYGERLASALVRLLDERLNKWQREVEQHLERGDDVGIATALRSCLREVEGDLEAARIAATPTPRPATRSLKEWAESRATQE